MRSLSEGGIDGSRIGEGLGTYEGPFSAYQYRYIQRELSHVALARGGSGAVADKHDRHHGLDDNTLWTGPVTHGLCERDSGGPSYLAIAAGLPQVAGVHSYVEHNVSCTGNNFDARVNVHGDWIEPFIRTADPGFLPDSVPDAGADPVDASVEDGGPAPAAAPTTRIETSGGCALTPARFEWRDRTCRRRRARAAGPLARASRRRSA